MLLTDDIDPTSIPSQLLPMLASAVKGSGSSICIRCAYRSRLLSLQQQRLRSTFPARRNDTTANGIPIRYHVKATDYDNTSGDRARRVGPVKTGVVRRPSFTPAPDLQKWGLDDGSQNRRNEEKFRFALVAALDALEDDLRNVPVLDKLVDASKGEAGSKAKVFNKLWRSFKDGVLGAAGSVAKHGRHGKGKASEFAAVWDDLFLANRIRGKNGLEERIKYAFYGYVTGSRFTPSDIRNQKDLADLRYPSEWFPATRRRPREIHLHVGPTNSGKTYHALQRLEQAESGCYAGPLRLLAHEVYTRMNAKGVPCRLVTGEERRSAEERPAATQEQPGKAGEVDSNLHRYLTSCTVEMVPLNTKVDVAVIDEIQMIGDPDRGWAWTNALLGVQAKEVHLCGEERTVPLITEICASIGDKLHVHHYQRLSPLQVASTSLNGDLSLLRKGDCIVSFSVVGIHALRREIEKRTGRKVAIVYGSLPPETRAQQARLFNDPNNDYDFLVASDAVGMGLNLAIKRMIFESSSKFDGVARGPLSIAAIKQIGGRAGRFRTAAQATDAAATPEALEKARAAQPTIDPHGVYIMNRAGDVPDNIGLVTTLEDFDYPVVLSAMRSEPEPLATAGIFPPTPVLERFASYFPPGTPFSYILTRLHELSQMHRRFHLCGLRDQVWVADLIEPVQGLTINDRNMICACPAAKGDIELWRKLMPAFARCIATGSGGDVLDIEELPLDILDEADTITREQLKKLEQLHKGLVAYLWLSYRFAGVFRTRPLATHVKGLVEEKIEYVLANLNLDAKKRRAMLQQKDKAIREQAMRDAAAAAAATGGEGEGEGGVSPEMEEKDGLEAQDAEEDMAVISDAPSDGPPSIDIDELITDALDTREVAASPDQFSGEEDVVFEEPDAPLAEEDSVPAEESTTVEESATVEEATGTPLSEEKTETELSPEVHDHAESAPQAATGPQ
ncbi:unnamed protein product [Zymoseptoria tritici ST99CH_1E4]|uniref:RNA helicase n=1 Tax=Zymoseptoria tritici ST99CH_1E4 TaxID=1276532 RepID=A0A2H1GXB4_ZYMTR|nr:unnamed protein product [Zymoseptoria tritici ST99CH_1E4]